MAHGVDTERREKNLSEANYN